MSDDAERSLEENMRRLAELDEQSRAIFADIRRKHRELVAQFELSDRITKIERDVAVLKGRLDRRDSAATRR